MFIKVNLCEDGMLSPAHELGRRDASRGDSDAPSYRALHSLIEQLESLSNGFILAVPFTAARTLSLMRFTRKVEIPVCIAYELPSWDDPRQGDTPKPGFDSYTITIQEALSDSASRRALYAYYSEKIPVILPTQPASTIDLRPGHVLSNRRSVEVPDSTWVQTTVAGFNTELNRLSFEEAKRVIAQSNSNKWSVTSMGAVMTYASAALALYELSEGGTPVAADAGAAIELSRIVTRTMQSELSTIPAQMDEPRSGLPYFVLFSSTDHFLSFTDLDVYVVRPCAVAVYVYLASKRAPYAASLPSQQLQGMSDALLAKARPCVAQVVARWYKLSTMSVSEAWVRGESTANVGVQSVQSLQRPELPVYDLLNDGEREAYVLNFVLGAVTDILNILDAAVQGQWKSAFPSLFDVYVLVAMASVRSLVKTNTTKRTVHASSPSVFWQRDPLCTAADFAIGSYNAFVSSYLHIYETFAGTDNEPEALELLSRFKGPVDQMAESAARQVLQQQLESSVLQDLPQEISGLAQEVSQQNQQLQQVDGSAQSALQLASASSAGVTTLQQQAQQLQTTVQATSTAVDGLVGKIDTQASRLSCVESSVKKLNLGALCLGVLAGVTTAACAKKPHVLAGTLKNCLYGSTGPTACGGDESDSDSEAEPKPHSERGNDSEPETESEPEPHADTTTQPEARGPVAYHDGTTQARRWATHPFMETNADVTCGRVTVHPHGANCLGANTANAGPVKYDSGTVGTTSDSARYRLRSINAHGGLVDRRSTRSSVVDSQYTSATAYWRKTRKKKKLGNARSKASARRVRRRTTPRDDTQHWQYRDGAPPIAAAARERHHPSVVPLYHANPHFQQPYPAAYYPYVDQRAGIPAACMPYSTHPYPASNNVYAGFPVQANHGVHHQQQYQYQYPPPMPAPWSGYGMPMPAGDKPRKAKKNEDNQLPSALISTLLKLLQ